MMTRRSLLGPFVMLLALCAMAAPAAAALDVADPSAGEYFDPQSVVLPQQTRAKTFRPEENRANFTHFEGAENVRVEDGVLRFTLAKPQATIGWGNFNAAQPLAERADLWPSEDRVVLSVRQSSPRTQWTMWYWADGERVTMSSGTYDETTTTAKAAIEGADEWHDLLLHASPVEPAPDGLEFLIEGEPGTEMEIREVRIEQHFREGYVRGEFEVPDGPVWRAVVEVSAQPVVVDGVTNYPLFVNGQQVPRMGAAQVTDTAAVNIARYLKPGKNVIGMYARGVRENPLLFVEGAVIMQSGEIIDVQTGGGWRYAPTAEENWSTSDFDASGWQPAALGRKPSVGSRTYATVYPFPVHTGYLQIRSAPNEKLFYNSQENVTFEVHVPAGLAARQPVLEYDLAPTDAQGRSLPTDTVSLSEFTERDGSLIYTVDAGQHDRGVYALSMRLRDSNSVIETRPREPLVVVSRLEQQPISGDDWWGSLNVELEDTIDFTDPGDPHPWIEGEPAKVTEGIARTIETPAVVRENGLVYRETAPTRGAYFSYRFQFNEPGSFYLLELDYPDDDRRLIEAVIASKLNGVWTNSQAGVGAETGGKHYKTGKMQTLRWIHVADPGVHSIDIVSGENGLKAAAKALRIYRIKGDLPTAQAGDGRLYGIFTERTAERSGVGTNFGVDLRIASNRRFLEDAPSADVRPEEPASLMDRTIQDLQWHLETCEKYVQYLKFTGQNVHVMGVYQYHEPNTPFARPDEVETARILPTFKSVLAHVLDANDIGFFASLEISQFREVETAVNNTQLARGANSIWMVNRDGGQYYGNHLFTIVPNWIHPDYQARYEMVVRQSAQKYAHLENFRGLHFYTSPVQRWEYYPPGFANGDNYADPLLHSYDDQTFAKFASDTGVDLGIARDDTQRFQKRAAAIEQSPELREQFVKWRAGELHRMMKRGLEIIQQQRDDLQYVVICPLEEPEFYRNWLSTGRDFTDLLMDYGYDLDAFQREQDMGIGRVAISWREIWPLTASQNPYVWIAKTEPRVTEAFDAPNLRYVMIRNSWDENIGVTGGYPGHTHSFTAKLVESDWIMDAIKVRALPQPAGFNAREAFIEAMATSDPDLLLGAFTDLNINVGYEQILGKIMRPFTRMPRAKFTPVLDTTLESNLVIRELKQEGGRWFYLANPGYWATTAEVAFASDAPLHNVGGQSETPLEFAGDRHVLQFELEPYDLIALRADDPEQQIVGYMTGSITSHEEQHMQDVVDRVEFLMNSRAASVLSQDQHEFMIHNIDRINTALSEERFGEAWFGVKHWRFWSIWQDLLEPANEGMADLPEQVAVVDRESTRDGDKAISVPRAQATPQIDGSLDEAGWSEVPFSAGFITRHGHQAMAETGVKAMHDSENVYFAFACADPDPTQVKAQAQGTPQFWATQDDVLVMFLQPHAERPNYFQLGFNTAGNQFHQRIVGGDKSYEPLEGWYAMTSLGHDGYWTAEVVIPKAMLGLQPDETPDFRANFHRVFRDHKIEHGSWSYVPTTWHAPAEFGKLEFE